MRAAFAPPRRHRGTENATIALRDIRVDEEISCNYFDFTAIDTPLISGEQYFDGARLIHVLLGPATVALAIPLYVQIEHVRRSALVILVAVCIGAATGAMSAIGLAWLFGAPDVIVKSLAAKSVTTPIAMGLSEQFGGLLQCKHCHGTPPAYASSCYRRLLAQCFDHVRSVPELLEQSVCVFA